MSYGFCREAGPKKTSYALGAILRWVKDDQWPEHPSQLDVCHVEWVAKATRVVARTFSGVKLAESDTM